MVYHANPVHHFAWWTSFVLTVYLHFYCQFATGRTWWAGTIFYSFLLQSSDAKGSSCPLSEASSNWLPWSPHTCGFRAAFTFLLVACLTYDWTMGTWSLSMSLYAICHIEVWPVLLVTARSSRIRHVHTSPSHGIAGTGLNWLLWFLWANARTRSILFWVPWVKTLNQDGQQ